MTSNAVREKNNKVRKFTSARNEIDVSNLLDVPFLLPKTPSSLAVDVVKDERTFTVPAGEGALFLPLTASYPGDVIEIANQERFIQARVLAVAGDEVTIDIPLNHNYLAGAAVFIGNDDLRVDGSTTPVVFKVTPTPSQTGIFTRILLYMEATADMDGGTFGPRAALPVGLVVRKKLADGDYVNLLVIRTNGDFVAKAYDGKYEAANGQGVRAFTSRLTWEKFGASIELDGEGGEELEIVVQDDLSVATNLTFKRLTFSLQGKDAEYIMN